MGKEHYFSVYTGDFSLFSYVNERAEKFKSRNEYFWKLVEMDKKGLILWSNESGSQKDKILEEIREELRIISQTLGVNVSTKQFEKVIEKTVEIGKNVSREQVINILIDEGIL